MNPAGMKLMHHISGRQAKEFNMVYDISENIITSPRDNVIDKNEIV